MTERENARVGLWSYEASHVIAYVDETRSGGLIYNPPPVDHDFRRFAIVIPDALSPRSGWVVAGVQAFKAPSEKFTIESLSFENSSLHVHAINETHELRIDIDDRPCHHAEVKEKLVEEFGKNWYDEHVGPMLDGEE